MYGVQGSAAELPKLGYRPALDGIRAVAILAVFAYHSGTPLRGAFIGVDIFFVLSGFLITTLLLQERYGTGSIAFRDFYGRRAARLLPALFLTILGVGLIYALDPEMHLHTPLGFGGVALSVIFYSSNWFIAFAGDKIPNTLEPTWSLAIEEQFYLLWPPLLAVCLWRGWPPRRLLILTAGLAAGSAILRGILFSVHRGGNLYFRSDTRADGLLLGCALAAAYSSPAGRQLTRRFLAPLPLGFIAAAGLLLFAIGSNPGDPSAYHGGLFVVVICAAALVGHVVNAQQSLLTRALALPVLVWIGARSYGMYLFQIPIFDTIGASPIGNWPGRVVVPLQIGITMLAAAASYKWIESPFLRRHRLRGAPPHVQRVDTETQPPRQLSPARKRVVVVAEPSGSDEG
jgi:peptidoglycan/LPS O-acetylase OafA/YrhL